MSERIDQSSNPPDEFEQALARLKPRASGVSRDRVMFRAGRNDALRELRAGRGRVWPLATAASWLVTAAMTGLWLHAGAERARRPLTQQATTDVTTAAAASQQETSTDAAIATSDFSGTASGERPDTNGRRTPAASSRNVKPFEFDLTMQNFDELPRFSMVGWQDIERDRSRDGRAKHVFTGEEPPVAPPATYARLMKLYLDDDLDPKLNGDVL